MALGAFLTQAMAFGGDGLQVYGQHQAGRQQNAMARYNARVMEQRARAVEMASAAETSRAHKQARRLKASQLAAYAKSGALPTEGTPLTVLAEQAGEMEKDILQQRRTRAIQAQQFRAEGEMLRFQGKQAQRAGNIGAFTTLLSTGSKVADVTGMFG